MILTQAILSKSADCNMNIVEVPSKDAVFVGQASQSLPNTYQVGFACAETEQVSTLPLVPCPPVGSREMLECAPSISIFRSMQLK